MFEGKTIIVDGHYLQLSKPDSDVWGPGECYEVRVGIIGPEKYEVRCAIGALDYNCGEIFVGELPYLFSQPTAPDGLKLAQAPTLRKKTYRQLNKLCKRTLWLNIVLIAGVFLPGARFPLLLLAGGLAGWCLVTAIDVQQKLNDWYFEPKN